MKRGFYFKTALWNVKKNYRFYVPQMLTGSGLLACLYIVFTLKSDKSLASVHGGEYIPTFMSFGTLIISVLSVILILYTNSFLMRQRKREYGLYSVLGLEKRHIGRIMFFETSVNAVASVVAGSFGGILFYKICSLFICRLLDADIIFGFDFIKTKTIIPPALFFLAVYSVAFIINRISIARLNPVQLLVSRGTGEKEPVANRLIFFAGVSTLAAGYIISVVTKSPLAAIILCFAAVILVIIGTYCLFTSGSIFVLKKLKDNKKYYYSKNHLPSVSGLLFRMKQNAVGLASVCILSTGVLVLISTTVSLYCGMQETLDNNYPQDLYFSFSVYPEDGTVKHIPGCELEKAALKSADKYGIKIKSCEIQTYLNVSYVFDGRNFITRSSSLYSSSDLVDAVFITEDTYRKLTGKTLNLKENEIAVGITATTFGATKQPGKSVCLHETEYNVVSLIDDFPIESGMAMVSPSCYGIVVSNERILDVIYGSQKNDYGDFASEMTERIAVTYENRDKAVSVGTQMQDEMFRITDEYAEKQNLIGEYEGNCQSYWEAKDAVVGMYGTLLFLGIILGLVCLFAAVLIIYYKQISEGYEDRDRYQIMKKVGMSDAEIAKTIRSQTLLVFFLPLVTAGVHTAFAFPILNRLLHIILLSSTGLFVLCSFITYAVFALIYVLIYSLTAKTYYKIVD